MPRRLDIGARRALAKHLLDWIAGNQVDQQEDNRDHQPQHGHCVQEPVKDVAQHQSPVLLTVCGCCSRVSTLTFEMRWPSISTTVKRRPSKSNDSPATGILWNLVSTKPASVSKPSSRGKVSWYWLSRSRMFAAPSSTMVAPTVSGLGGAMSNSSSISPTNCSSTSSTV